MLVPGAFLFPKDYAALLAAFAEAAAAAADAAGVHFWAAVAPIDWAQVTPQSMGAGVPGMVSEAVEKAVEVAAQKGFSAETVQSGKLLSVLNPLLPLENIF